MVFDAARLQQLLAWIEAECGIVLSPERREFLQHRLESRAQAPVEQVLLRLSQNDAAARLAIVEAVCTHETRLFRDGTPYTLIESKLAPALREAASAGRRERVLRVWSAACSTGEEPASLAAVLSAALPGWRLEILATDVSTAALELARARTWPESTLAGLPATWRAAFEPTEVPGHVRLRQELRQRIEYRALNLVKFEPANQRYDLIFCRNVLIYFRKAMQKQVLARLMQTMAPEGWLVSGQSEGLLGLGVSLVRVGDCVYRKSDEGGSP